MSRVSRTGAEVEPGFRRTEQKQRRFTCCERCASVEVPVLLRGVTAIDQDRERINVDINVDEIDAIDAFRGQTVVEESLNCNYRKC